MWHVIDAENDGRSHRQGQYPGGREQDDLPLVDVLTVVGERNRYRDEPAGMEKKSFTVSYESVVNILYGL